MIWIMKNWCDTLSRSTGSPHTTPLFIFFFLLKIKIFAKQLVSDHFPLHMRWVNCGHRVDWLVLSDERHIVVTIATCMAAFIFSYINFSRNVFIFCSYRSTRIRMFGISIERSEEETMKILASFKSNRWLKWILIISVLLFSSYVEWFIWMYFL